MSRRLTSALVSLAIGLTGCAGVRDRIAALPQAGAGFDSAELVDVLAPNTIPAIDRPVFEDPSAAAARLQPADPVAVLEVAGDARAYPLAIMVWHEIVNDVVGGDPVVVTYAPLTGSAAAFRRTAGNRVFSFSSSGKLYRSNLVLYDRATRSLWPQLRGAAVLGPRSGLALERLPIRIVSFGDFRSAFPGGSVLTAQTGAARVYGATPYAGYDSRRTPSRSFFAPRPDRRLFAMERVLGVTISGQARAYPYAELRGAGSLEDRIGGREVVVLWRPGTRSPLDKPLIAEGRDTGSAAAFEPVAEGRRLHLTVAPEGFRDRETGSSWSVLGIATGGSLRGQRLTPLIHADAFWFAWAAFNAGTSIYGQS